MQPDLFGNWCLVREWGRIGSAGLLCAPQPVLLTGNSTVRCHQK
ncbi:MAG: WGR domain-containing protein [Bryobacteraceae bacterium]